MKTLLPTIVTVAAVCTLTSFSSADAAPGKILGCYGRSVEEPGTTRRDLPSVNLESSRQLMRKSSM
jgi:hypothetical protein